LDPGDNTPCSPIAGACTAINFGPEETVSCKQRFSGPTVNYTRGTWSSTSRVVYDGAK
jgi:hypothetical protein